jgi:DNA-binding LacI/PurR family transcriptional regulator
MTCTGIHTGLKPFARLAAELRAAIVGGTFAPGALIGSEHELARQHKLARMTVRKAVQTLVDEGLLERKPGKGLFVRDHGSETRTVRMMAGNLCWEPAVQISRAAREVAKQRGVALQLVDAHGHLDEDLDAIRRLPASGTKGAVIMSLHCPAFFHALCELHVVGFPFVVVDQRLREVDAPSVSADNAMGGHLVGAALLAAGHRRVAFLGDLDVSTTHDRLLGLREELADAGCSLDRALVVDVQGEDRLGDWGPRVSATVRELMLRDDRPTALACSCDAVARAAYRALGDIGLRVPHDVSVTGFDDDPLAQWLTPGLSTVRQPFQDIGRAAMELLLDRMADPSRSSEHRELPVEFITRGSVAAPPVAVPLAALAATARLQPA